MELIFSLIIIYYFYVLIKNILKLFKPGDKYTQYYNNRKIYNRSELPENNLPGTEFLEIHKHNKTRVQSSDFHCRKSLMTPIERSFFENLRNSYEEKYDIYPQIHLGAIFAPNNNWKFGPRNKLNKRIDFLIVNRQFQTPILGIELDDISHSRDQKKIGKDNFIEELFKSNNIHFVRFNNGNYNSNDIMAKLQNYFLK